PWLIFLAYFLDELDEMVMTRKNSVVLSFSIFIVLVALSPASHLMAQPSRILNSAELKLALKKLTVLGSVLYVGAHPDDENTALLAYLTKEKNYRSAYLSMTRGSGGQNLIGSEKGELIGIIRTHELLQARRIDGAEQFFTRAVDFGYSKSPQETLEIWGKEHILSDVVWMIRTFRPDVMITRFPAAVVRTHGHHIASAILANEAFKLAGDPARFSEQLQYVSVWQPKRILWNVFRRGRPGRDLDVSDFLQVDIGSYNQLLGKSYTEIAAESRSMHKSQGFGARGRRGSRLNYFQLVDGAPTESDLFHGIDVSWSRIQGGEITGQLLHSAYEDFQPANPAASLPTLLKAFSELNKLEKDYWVNAKRIELLQVIQSCAGLWFEAVAHDFAAAPGNEVKIALEVVNRCQAPFVLEKIGFPFSSADTTIGSSLHPNKPFTLERSLEIPKTAAYTHPYWLESPPKQGLFQVADQVLIGRAEAPKPASVSFVLAVDGQRLEFEVPLLYRWTDRVAGERYRKFEIRPAVTANLDAKVYLFPDDQVREVHVTLKSAKPNASGELKLRALDGWQISPPVFSFTIDEKYGEAMAIFIVQPPGGSHVSTLEAEVAINGGVLSRSLVEIDHPHIPRQTVFPAATAKLIRLNIEKRISKIGYIMGSGDEIPSSLIQLGYEVTSLEDPILEKSNLSEFDAIVVGVRAYNTRQRLRHVQSKLLDYVEKGGTLVVQYNVSRGLVTTEIGPYPFKLSRDRVTLESAPVTFVDSKHPLLNFPNKITERDFDGWVQERGLYFANEWDKRYESVLSCHDPGEKPLRGGMLYARYGKGVFIYTGFSWFRQLPAGVPGAYRLFVNVISAGKYREGTD
ncbi:MAG: PIG-L family deacetylase, partial [bacterium]